MTGLMRVVMGKKTNEAIYNANDIFSCISLNLIKKKRETSKLTSKNLLLKGEAYRKLGRSGLGWFSAGPKKTGSRKNLFSLRLTMLSCLQ